MEADFNQPPLPQIKYSGVPDMPDNTPRIQNDGLLVTQSQIRSNAKAGDGGTALTQDLFSSLGNEPKKQRFESYTPYKASDIYATTSQGESVAMYENYIAGTDNNERLAKQQTTGEKWSNGITKALAKTGSAVLGGTAGLVYGVGAALNDGSFSSIYDNSFSNTLSDWDTKLQYQFSNLYTKQEQEKGLFGQLGTANFWADKFLGGLSFTAGAILSEGIWAYATGGASLATLGARLGTKTASRWGVEALGEAAALQGVSKYKGFYKTMLENTVTAGKISKTAANNLGRAGELVSSVGILARSAGYEASVEALQYKREAEENFHQNFVAMNGREPSQEEVSEFKSNLESSSNAVFGANMAILMPSNLVTMGHILDIKSPIKTGFSSFIDKKAFGYGVGKTVDNAGKTVYKALEATRGQRIARTAFNYAIKPAATEGLFEEGLQGVATKTANKWIEHTYDPRHTSANFDTMGAFYESLGEQYGTKEGWVENGLGMLIGIVGGAANVSGEMKQKAAELSYESAVATTFQTKNLQAMLMPNRVQSANRMAGFSEEARIEAQKGNVSRAALAQKSSLLTYINAKMTLGEDISDIVKEVKLGLDSTTEDQWKGVGINADQIDAHKEETLKEFEDLAKDWKANKTYWGYMIGKKLVGQEALDTEIAGVEGKIGGTTAIVEALAWQSTIGETANKQMKEAQDAIARELGTEYSNTLDLNSRLQSQKLDLRKEINAATRSYKVETARRDALVTRIAKLNAAPKTPEGANKPAGKQAGALTQALIESEQKLAELDTQLQGYAEQINKTTAYQKELGAIDFSSQDLSTDIITGQDLVSLQDNIEKFGIVIETLHATNPQRASYIDELLKEYTDSKDVFYQNQVTQRIISNPDFKIEQINSWLQGKIKGGKPMNPNTQEWLTDALETYQKAKVASMSEQAEARDAEALEARKQEIIEQLNAIEDPEDPRIQELQEELDSLEKPAEEVKIPEDKGEVKPKSREQQIVDEIYAANIKRTKELSEEGQTEEEIAKINKKYDTKIKTLQDELAGKELTQLEVYKNRIAEALKGRHNYLTYLGDTYDDVANKKPTQAEVDEFVKLRDGKKFDDPRYQELQQKLSDWKLLDSAVDEQYVSIGDLIIGVEQLEQEIEQADTLDEITPEHADDIADNESTQASESMTKYEILQNTNGSATAKRHTDGNLTLHHVKLATIATNMGFDPSVDTLKNSNGKEIVFGNEEVGAVLTVGGVQFTLVGGNAIKVKESDFMPLQQKLNMFPLNTGKVTWTYVDIYTKVGDEFVKMESDIKDDSINGERIYELKQGDKLTITINNADGYNAKLLREYEKAKEGEAKEKALKNLKDNLKLSATTTTGTIENVSTLKAQREEVNQHFIRLRERAFELYMAAEDKDNINLGITVTVDGIFLGSPRFKIGEDGKTQASPITEREAKEVEATGYIEDGNLVLSKVINDVNTTYVGKLSKNNAGKKIPIVVFRRGNYMVAYPVTMNKTLSSLASEFDSIMDMRISDQEKIRKINQAIQDNKIQTDKLVYEDISNQEKLDATRGAFEEFTTFISAADFADSNYKTKNLVTDASIDIDLGDIDGVVIDAKLRIKLDDSIKYTTDRDLKYESMIGVENELSDLARELYRDYTSNAQTKYVDSKGNIIEDTGYTDTFDDNSVEVPTNQLEKIKNINTLRKAFEGLTPALKKIIGKDKIDEVNKLFEQYDFLKSQITPNASTAASGKKASQC